MLVRDLITQLKNFMREFLVVEKSQLVRFFSDWESANYVEHKVRTLINQCFLYEQPGGFISYDRYIGNITEYMDTILGLDILCSMRSSDIKEVWLQRYPRAFGFITSDDVVHDVTVFTETDWAAKYAVWKMTQGQELADPSDDPICHVAYASSPDIWNKVKDLGFSFYALPVSKNGKRDVALHEVEE